MEYEETVAQLLRGDARCLERILAELGPRVAGLLRRQFGASLDTHEIDDAISVGLYRLWKSRSRYESSKSSLLTWFYLLVRNAAIDLMRSRRPYVPLHETETETKESQPISPATGIEHSKRRQVLAEYLRGLSDTDRLILKSFAESSGEGNWATTVADELHMPASTVRVRKMRLVESIRKKLEEMLPSLKS